MPLDLITFVFFGERETQLKFYKAAALQTLIYGGGFWEIKQET
jgi:hypothetical protein